MEAFQAGLPAVCMDHHGAREIMRPEFGEVAPDRTALWQAIAGVLSDEQALEQKSMAVRLYAGSHQFSQTAERLASVLENLWALR